MTRLTLAIDPSVHTASIRPVSDGRLWRSVAAAVLVCAATWSGRVLFRGPPSPGCSSGSVKAARPPPPWIAACLPSLLRDGRRIATEGVPLYARPGRGTLLDPLSVSSAGASTRVRRIQAISKNCARLGFTQRVRAFDCRGFGGNRGTPSRGFWPLRGCDSRHTDLSLTRTASAATPRDYRRPVAGRLRCRRPGDARRIWRPRLLPPPISSVPAAAARLYPWAPVRWLALISIQIIR